MKVAKIYKIYIDAGHGGSSPGAVGKDGTKEKDLVLERALGIAKGLEKYEGVEVKLSRKTDITKSLAQRCKEATAWGADLFWSEHTNAFGQSSPNGFDTHIAKNAYAKTVELQKVIHKHLAKVWKDAGRADRGYKRNNFYVLVNTPTANAILVENGFITNDTDLSLLKNKQFVQKLIDASVAGIVEWFDLKPKKVNTVPELPKAQPKDTEIYKVKKGENLTVIAKKHKTTLQQLLKLNPQITNPNLIHINQEIYIPIQKKKVIRQHIFVNGKQVGIYGEKDKIEIKKVETWE